MTYLMFLEYTWATSEYDHFYVSSGIQQNTLEYIQDTSGYVWDTSDMKPHHIRYETPPNPVSLLLPVRRNTRPASECVGVALTGETYRAGHQTRRGVVESVTYSYKRPTHRELRKR